MSPSPFDMLVGGLCQVASVPFRLASRNHQIVPPEKVLIIRTCCIGDVLLATPVAAALKRSYPGVRIDWAVGTWSRPMLVNNPRLNKLINAEEVGAGRPLMDQVQRLVDRIREEAYDTCLVLHRSPVMASIPWRARIPQRIGLDSYGRGFCHHVRVPADMVQHEAETFLHTVREFGISTKGARTEFYPTEQDQAVAYELLVDQLGWREGDPLFVFHPAGGRNPGMMMVSKRWPPERYALLAKRLLNRYGGMAILLGGPQDRVLLEATQGLIAGKVPILAGEIEWGVWGALLEQATLCVGNDTGATHLAVAVGTKTVFIFGPSDPRRYGPYAQAGRAAALWHPIAGMVNGVSGGVPPDWSWEQGVTADEAWHAAQTLLEDGQGG